ncbi:MAG: hypothetical protein ACKVQK_09900 [Burkholderiales bacterium]
MTADDLQRLASILRWVGLMVTAVGVFITFGSHYVADKLLNVQAAEKLKAKERLQVTEVELEATKLKTAELAKRLAPRTLTPDQHQKFIMLLSKSTKGPVTIEHSGQGVETVKFSEEIRALLEEAGFTIGAYNMALSYVFKEAPEPWFITVIAITGKYPAYGDQIILAFREIGIDVLLGNGEGIANPGEFKIYVGAK